MAQDSALRAYQAKSFLRLSVGMGVRAIGRERLLMRVEEAWRVQWSRGSPIWVEPTARRFGVPMGGANGDMSWAAPVPYFPGRESLWIPSSKMGVAQAEVDENELLHPLATGAEAYYRYAAGDSLTIRLPDGRPIKLRELRITARRPDWRAFVGSFWFDVDRGNLVRAAYRLSTEIDMWQLAQDEYKQTMDSLLEVARTDTGAAARAARKEAERQHMGIKERIAFNMVRGTLRPARANLSAVTVEYGLYAGRFWLPKLDVAEGEVQFGFMRLPIRWEESFRYDNVSGTDSLALPTIAQASLSPDDTLDFLYAGGTLNVGSGPQRDSLNRAARDSANMVRFAKQADSLRAQAERAKAKGDTVRAKELLESAKIYARLGRHLARRKEGCAKDSTYFAGTTTLGTVKVAVRIPCDESKLANSPDLPGSIYASGEELFGTTERDQLLGSLGFSLQPGWGPQRPVFLTGPGLMRYNRIEGLSLGAAVSSTLGLGYSAEAKARFGFGDQIPNGELSLTHSTGRSTLRLGVFHRLAVANDDWGNPLSFGASLANVLYARDEGFYYRTWGLELAGARDAQRVLGGATMQWRLFAERQRSAGTSPNTQVSFGDLFADPRFTDNIEAAQLTSFGGSWDLARSFGLDPNGFRLSSRFRSEAALIIPSQSGDRTNWYSRFVFDGTLSRRVGPLAAGLTGAAGVSPGQGLPPQRYFYMGGLQTVRGQFARVQSSPDDGRAGDTFWLARSELGLSGVGARPTVFYDAGWAGSSEVKRPLSGAGVGLSFLDGLFRLDVARGIWPEKRWRTDLYLDARF